MTIQKDVSFSGIGWDFGAGSPFYFCVKLCNNTKLLKNTQVQMHRHCDKALLTKGWGHTVWSQCLLQGAPHAMSFVSLKFFIVLLQLASLHDLSLSAAPVSSLLVDVLWCFDAWACFPPDPQMIYSSPWLWNGCGGVIPSPAASLRLTPACH